MLSDVIEELKNMNNKLSVQEYLTDTSLEFFTSCPLPMWIKEIDFETKAVSILAFNNSTVTTFNLHNDEEEDLFKQELIARMDIVIESGELGKYNSEVIYTEEISIKEKIYECRSVKNMYTINDNIFINTTILDIEVLAREEQQLDFPFNLK